MSSRAELTEQVQSRAVDRCEYCLMHQALQGASFHVEHIMPASLGGATELHNLAWACPSCNLHKSSRIEATDPNSGDSVRLFNPRTDRWLDHFRWEGYRVEGLTDTGRATVVALMLNSFRRLLIRQAEEGFDLFPPGEGS